MIVEALNIQKFLGYKLVLRGLSFSLRAGERVLIRGSNGAGKSTLLSCLAGVQRIDNGTLSFFGNPPRSRRSGATGDRRVGYVSQSHPFFYPLLSPRENLTLFAELAGVSFDRVNDLIDRFGMTWFAEQRSATLSEGMKRRLMLARALVTDPALLLLDEPTTGLDAAGCQLLNDEIQRFTDDGGTLILVSHDEQFGTRHVNSSYSLKSGLLEVG